MSENITKACDVKQGFNLAKDKNTVVGFLVSFTIGGVSDLSADITVKDPKSPDTDLKVFAVLHDISWSGKKTDPLHFSGQISVNNKNAIDIALKKSMTDISTKFKFTVYDYDPSDKKYFETFHGADKELQGRIEKQGSALALSVGDYKNNEIQSPENYSFSVTMVPESAEQELHYANATDKKIVKQWGVKDRE